MLIAISKYLKSLEEVDVHRKKHHEYLKPLFASGKLLISGRQNPPVGGVIMSKILSLAEFKEILREDPFSQAGVARYEVIEFTPVLGEPSLIG